MAKKKGSNGVIPVLGPLDRYINDYAPELMPVYLTLLPFSYLFGSACAGPQPQHKGKKEKPFIELHIDDPRYPGGEDWGVSLYCRITAEKIVMQWHCVSPADGKCHVDESEITLGGLWHYLSQIPRPHHCFCKGD